MTDKKHEPGNLLLSEINTPMNPLNVNPRGLTPFRYGLVVPKLTTSFLLVTVALISGGISTRLKALFTKAVFMV